MSPVEVIMSVERRRRFSAQQKYAMVEETELPGNSVSSVARKYEVHPNQLFKWRKLIHEGSLVAASHEEPVVPLSEVKQLKAHIRELERLLGKKTMEVEILKEAVQIAREKKLISRAPLPPGEPTP
jgi:transposase